jgi:GMP synthase-like glutamine amidotransferase
MTRKLKVLILQHEEPTPPGYLAEWLEEQKADVDVHRIDLHEWTDDPREYDFIASLGSEFAAFDDSKPFIPREADLLRAATKADVPVLGLCFGGQLPVSTEDPDLVSEGPWFNWHFDSFTLPPGARLIAETSVAPQAYVVGRNLGLQFHPEVTPEIMESWVKAYRHELDGDGVDPDALLEETHRLAPEVRRRSERLFNAFLTRVTRLRPEAARGR